MAVRKGYWKLMPSPAARAKGQGKVGAELYDLAVDAGETTNIAPDHPAVAAELLGLLQQTATNGTNEHE